MGALPLDRQFSMEVCGKSQSIMVVIFQGCPCTSSCFLLMPDNASMVQIRLSQDPDKGQPTTLIHTAPLTCRHPSNAPQSRDLHDEHHETIQIQYRKDAVKRSCVAKRRRRGPSRQAAQNERRHHHRPLSFYSGASTVQPIIRDIVQAEEPFGEFLMHLSSCICSSTAKMSTG